MVEDVDAATDVDKGVCEGGKCDDGDKSRSGEGCHEENGNDHEHASAGGDKGVSIDAVGEEAKGHLAREGDEIEGEKGGDAVVSV